MFRRIRTAGELVRAKTVQLSLAAAILVIWGCSGPAVDNTATESVTLDQTAPVELVSVTLDEWRQEVDDLRGEIVVADMWATWCIPCIERFPHMVDLSRRYEGDGVRFISTCLDDPGDAQAVAYARQFLQEQQATFDNYLINGNIADSFEQLDLMTIPAVFIFGPDGELSYRLTADDPNNQFTDQDVEDAILELLGRSSTQD